MCGTFHANADQEQWYGWGPLKEIAVTIRYQAAISRADNM